MSSATAVAPFGRPPRTFKPHSRERELWRHFGAKLVNTLPADQLREGDSLALTQLCRSWAAAERLQGAVDDCNGVVRTANGEGLKAHPAARQAAAEWRLCEQLLVELRMTPKSRGGRANEAVPSTVGKRHYAKPQHPDARGTNVVPFDRFDGVRQDD